MLEFLVREGRGEWVAGGKRECWVWWRGVEEWADAVGGWVEGRGLRGSVLTVWEMLRGDGTVGEEFHGMDGEVFLRVLGVLVKRGKAQVFGEEDQLGVKFF